MHDLERLPRKLARFQDVKRELGDRYVLECSVRRVGENVRINAQLIDATIGRNLWAERYDGRVADVVDLPDKQAEKDEYMFFTLGGPLTFSVFAPAS